MIHTYYSTHKQEKSQWKYNTNPTASKIANNETTAATVMIAMLSLGSFVGLETRNILLTNDTHILQHSQTDKQEKSKQKHHHTKLTAIIIGNNETTVATAMMAVLSLGKLVGQETGDILLNNDPHILQHSQTDKQKKSNQKHHTKPPASKIANNEATVATVMMVVLSLVPCVGQETANTLLVNKTHLLQHSQTDRQEKSKQKHHTKQTAIIVVNNQTTVATVMMAVLLGGLLA